MYQIDPFALFTAQAWIKYGVEAMVVVKYGGKLWLNQGNFQKKLDLSDISERTEYYSSEFLKNEM